MTQKEKIVAALKICDMACLTENYCRKIGCPYVGGNRSGECIGQLHGDILAAMDGGDEKPLSLSEVAAHGKPVWIRHRTNHDFSGWALYHSEQRPYFKFDTFRGARIMLNTGTYGSEWECRTGKPV